MAALVNTLYTYNLLPPPSRKTPLLLPTWSVSEAQWESELLSSPTSTENSQPHPVTTRSPPCQQRSIKSLITTGWGWESRFHTWFPLTLHMGKALILAGRDENPGYLASFDTTPVGTLLQSHERRILGTPLGLYRHRGHRFSVMFGQCRVAIF